MSSLRTRLLAGVLLLSATGLVLLGVVTYAEQRSFLEGRVNQEVLAARNAVSQILDSRGYRPPLTGNAAHTNPAPSGALPGKGPVGRGPGVNLPPGTYGERKLASGKVLGVPLSIKYSSTEVAPPAPKIPANAPIGKLFTVHSVGPYDVHYRVYVSHDPEDVGLTAVAVPLSDVDQTLSRLLLVEGLVIGGVLLALGLTAFFVVRLGLRPLDRIEVTAGEIAGGELSRRVSPATPRTEVGRLGLALNAMLDRLERAFADRTASEERLRQFLADASHELRTPLASIRGYAELYRMGATEDAAGTEMAMRRIEDESKRMGILVEDLLTLARLDETPEMQHGPVDLTVLARDAVDDARATAPDRTIGLSTPDTATVSGDSHQLRQVLANLLRNALVHTPVGSPIEVSVERSDGAVTVGVRDHGPGLPSAAKEHLFDRFWRAEGGRERGKAGAGLGLAIAQAVVEAHRGQISAEDPAGGGALFVVKLPSSPSDPPQQSPA